MPIDPGLQVTSALVRPFISSMSGVLSEIRKAPFVASWIFLSKYRTVENYLFCSILSDTLLENWDTCFQMYSRNASLHHHPITIIVSGDTTMIYIAKAAPERMECSPCFMVPNLTCPLPRIWAAACNFLQITAEVIANLFSFTSMEVLT